MSSITAIASSSAFSATGTRLPSSARMPSAKAMSVAAGIAQPDRFSGVPRLIATNTSAGAAMPPIAANSGSEDCCQLDSWPVRTSRFTSSPTSRKNSAISPSLIQRSTVLSIPPSPTITASRMSSVVK